MSAAAMYLIFLGYLMVASAAREDKERLISDLTAGYNKLLQPEGENGTALRVEHSMNINRIVSLENGVLTTDGWATLKWTDESLRWVPKEYGDVKKITLPSRLFWQPDILLYNSATEYTGVPGDIDMMIQYDGQVLFDPPGNLLSYCRINDDNVSDVTNCNMTFGSWTQDANSIDLQHVTAGVDLSIFEHSFNKDWALVTVSTKRNAVKYAKIAGRYDDLVYTLKLKKRNK